MIPTTSPKNITAETLVGSPIPGNIPESVANSDRIPFDRVGLLRMTFPNSKEYYGTGTLIAINKNDTETKYVLTCAHNLYDQSDGGKATKVTFTRAYNKPDEPYPCVEADNWFYPDGYPDVAIPRIIDVDSLKANDLDAEISLDYGLVELKVAIKINLLPQMKAETVQQLKAKAVQLNGYGWFGTAMSHATGKIGVVTNEWLKYPISTRKGASGTAIMAEDNSTIVGVHTRGTSATENMNRGIRLTQKVIDKIKGWTN